MSKLLKLGASALAVVGAGTGMATTVINIKEIINYEDHYEINTTERYFIDGVEVDLETYNELAGFDVGYGKVSDPDSITLDDFTASRLKGTADTFTCTIVCGDPITEEGEYPIFALPETYVLTGLTTSMFDLSQNLIHSTLDGYNIYCYDTPVYDEDIGGESWTVYFAPAQF